MFQQPNLIGAGVGAPKNTFKLNSVMHYVYPDADRVPEYWKDYSLNDLMNLWDNIRSKKEFAEFKIRQHTEALKGLTSYICRNYKDWNDEDEEECSVNMYNIRETIKSYEDELSQYNYVLSLIESTFDIDNIQRRFKSSK